MKTLLILAVLAAPAQGFAQAAIAGIVTDQSGAVMPGVGVEASSPALIEGARRTLTDEGGHYRIDDLRPGEYQITFTLDGWRPYRMQNIELGGSLTAIANAKLLAGAFDTVVTVTGTSPLIDVRSSRRELTIGGAAVNALPTFRSYNALLALIPGVVTTSNDVAMGTATTAFPIHGGRTSEGRLQLDGLNVGSPATGNSAAS